MPESYFQKMPHFKTPEEELSYLRAHVARREEELVGLGHFENAKENAIKDVISEYKEVPIEEMLHKDNILKKNETLPNVRNSNSMPFSCCLPLRSVTQNFCSLIFGKKVSQSKFCASFVR